MTQNLKTFDVVGHTQTIQDQIAIKRKQSVVVDGLSAEDMAKPALSIGEALESITAPHLT